MTFKNKGKIKLLSNIKDERNHYQQTCTARNVKDSPSGIRKVIADIKMNPHKGMKNIKKVTM